MVFISQMLVKDSKIVWRRETVLLCSPNFVLFGNAYFFPRGKYRQ